MNTLLRVIEQIQILPQNSHPWKAELHLQIEDPSPELQSFLSLDRSVAVYNKVLNISIHILLFHFTFLIILGILPLYNGTEVQMEGTLQRGY